MKGLLSTWHNFRIPVIVSLVVFILFVRLFGCKRSKSPSSSSTPSSPRLESAIPKEKPVAPVLESKIAPAVNPTPKPVASGPKRVVGNKDRRGGKNTPKGGEISGPSYIKPVIFFASLTASTQTHAHWLSEQLRIAAREKSPGNDREWGLIPPEIYDLAEIDFDDHFITAPKPPANSPNRFRTVTV